MFIVEQHIILDLLSSSENVIRVMPSKKPMCRLMTYVAYYNYLSSICSQTITKQFIQLSYTYLFCAQHISRFCHSISAQRFVAGESGFSNQGIILEIRSQFVPDLTLVDLPGLIEVAMDGVDSKAPEMVSQSHSVLYQHFYYSGIRREGGGGHPGWSVHDRWCNIGYFNNINVRLP